jgi:N4-(beta-N-acetylglucosaminyl)-L-asparaginase
MKRRNFLKNASLTGVGLAVGTSLTDCQNGSSERNKVAVFNKKIALPLVIATWHVIDATSRAMEILKAGGTALDAVEQG